MKKFNLIMVCICFCAISAQGQLQMNSYGKMYLGPKWANQDLGNVLSGSIFGPGIPPGPNPDWKGGSKLAFGDFGQHANYGWNVFIGEYGPFDGSADQLWLHGKNGYYITNGGKPDAPLMYNPSLRSNAIYFTVDVFSPSVFTTSDARFKSNVTSIENPLNKLMNLRGVAYDFNDKERKDALAARHGEVISEPSDEPPSEKELQAMKEMQEWKELILQKEHKLGLIAQEVQKIFPNLVKEDDLGYLAVDYSGLIPVIIEAMKEQQRQIQKLEAQIAELSGTIVPKSFTPTVIEETKINTTNTFLYQNIPNPFTEKTEIRYLLPEDSRNAQLYIFNIQGQNVKTINLSGNGTGNIFIQGAELAPGTYIYTLYSNGKELDTKRMVLTK